MPLDLSGLIPIVDDLMMVDECTITRDEELTTDDTWDDATGTYAPPDPDEDSVYSGPCSVWSQNVQPRGERQGGVVQIEMWYFLAIPLEETVEIKPEDLVTVDSSQNPNLEGKQLIVVGETTGTFDVHRTFRLNEYGRVPGA